MTQTMTLLVPVEQGRDEHTAREEAETAAESFPEEVLDEPVFHTSCDALAAYGTDDAAELVEDAVRTARETMRPLLEDLRDQLTAADDLPAVLDDWEFRFTAHQVSDVTHNRFELYDATNHSWGSPVMSETTAEEIVADTDRPVYVARISFDR